MTSKQEKLAAARKKLKEYQGKSKEVDIAKQKISDALTPKIPKNDFSLNGSMRSPLPCSNDNSKESQPSIQLFQMMQHINSKENEQNENERKTSVSSWSSGGFSVYQPDSKTSTYDVVSSCPSKLLEAETSQLVSSCGNEQTTDLFGSDGKSDDSCKSCLNNVLTEKLMFSERSHGNSERTVYENEDKNSAFTEQKQFLNSDVDNKSALNDTTTSLQRELQSHAQTIAILVQQRNDAQTALAEMQSLLNKKSEEAAGMGQQIAHLTSLVNSLTHRLYEAEAVVMSINKEKEENLQKWKECKSLTDNFQSQLDQKGEEFQEMKRKYEEKSNHCQQLLISLQEAQAQLSLYQIQLQQYSNEGHSGADAQVSELQNENAGLKNEIEELKKKLEAENAEKEESSQKFHIYAQQCNSQLSSLNLQLKSLKLEKENLSKENIMLSKNLSEVENAKENVPQFQSQEAEIADLHNQISELSEENKHMRSGLKKIEEECGDLVGQLNEKEEEIRKLSEVVKELSDENKKLASEAEIPKANERLLATMESDKIAAAKAVSQNQRLKEQVIELEQAFMKLSEEKLELTNQLSHEKHVNAELQNMLKKNDENHDDHECHHEHPETEPLVNDSNQVEELRAIVRQLQDDKMELTARLNSYESNKKTDGKDVDDHDGSHEENGTQCEDTKLLLQQMKEKVRKTMNEIAVLDEEKEKLEHLVLQLQGETETIGEYITLYQKQRMLLRQRAQEKDIQLLQLSRDKEELKSKLSSLDELVQVLLAERENGSPAGECHGTKLEDLKSSAQVSDSTAGKIRALINEIGTTTLVNHQSIAFEHCPCCSGRLITI